MNEQVRHRAVQALEGEPGKVARASADTTQRHLGHALGGKAGNEAVAQVAHAADVDVAHRVVVSTREDGEKVEVLRGSLQAAQLHLRLQEAVLLPRRADGGHVLPRVGQQVDLGARVVVHFVETLHGLVAVVLSALQQVVHGHGAAVVVDVVAALAVGEDLDALDEAGGVGRGRGQWVGAVWSAGCGRP